jgi:long-subunit fatty acid transport protein
MKMFNALFVIVAAAVVTVSAQNHTDVLRYSTLGQSVGARALGMGNAFIGVSDDYTATFWNPAGLAQMKRLEFTGGIRNYSYANDAVYHGVTSTETVSATALDNVGFVFPFPTVRGSLVFGFGYNRYGNFNTGTLFNGFNPAGSLTQSLKPSDGVRKYNIPYQVFLTDTNGNSPITKNVNQEGQVREGGNIGEWTFSGAIDLAENISLGLSLNVVSGIYSYNKHIVEKDTRQFYVNTSPALTADSAYLRFNALVYDQLVESEISGGGVKVGLMYRSDFFRVGTVVKAPYSIDIADVNTEQGQSSFDPTGGWKNLKPDSSYSFKTIYDYTVSTPWSFGIGASWYPFTELLLAADVEYTDWSQVSWKNASDSQELSLEIVKLQSLFRPTMNIRVGAEYFIPSTEVRVRAGYINNPTKYKNLSSSYDETVITGGIGYFLQRDVVVEAGAAFGSQTKGNLQFNHASSQTDETVTTTLVTVTLSYRF